MPLMAPAPRAEVSFVSVPREASMERGSLVDLWALVDRR